GEEAVVERHPADVEREIDRRSDAESVLVARPESVHGTPFYAPAPARTAFRLLSSDASSFSKGSTNFFTPSSSSCFVAAARSRPTSLSCASFRCAPVRSSRMRPAGLPWSRYASTVSIGIVLTVSAPMRGSTYMVSLYLGFFVLVLAQS